MADLKRLKICFIAGTLGQGGAERQLYYNLIALKNCGAEPYVLSLSQGEYWQTPIEALDIPVIWVGEKPSRLARLRRVMQLVCKISPQIIQSQHFYVNLYAVAAARGLGLTDIGAIRSDGIKDIASSGKVFGYLGMKLPSVLLTNTRHAQSNMVKLGRTSSVFYLPNVVNTATFLPSVKPDRSDTHILMAGRLKSPKRFDTFLWILRQVNLPGNPKTVGHILGDGLDKSKLYNLAGQFNLGEDLLIFHGAMADVERIYRQADIYVHFSDWEGMPNTILEAMASGLPVIASQVGGIPEVVQDGKTGFLVDHEDQETIVKKLLCLITDPELQRKIGLAGRSFVEQNHSLDILPGYLEKLYGKILH